MKSHFQCYEIYIEIGVMSSDYEIHVSLIIQSDFLTPSCRIRSRFYTGAVHSVDYRFCGIGGTYQLSQ